MPRKNTKPTVKRTPQRKASALDYVVATLPNGRQVKLYGDAVAAAKKSVSKSKAALGQTEIAELQADSVMYFLTLGDCENASTPDFVTDAVIDAVDEAGKLTGLPTPTYNDDQESEAERRKMLVELFSQTKMLRLRDDKHKVLRATVELLHNPETPSGLFQEVSEFVTDQSNECGENLYHSSSYLTEVLKSVRPEERMGAVIAAREAEEGGAQ